MEKGYKIIVKGLVQGVGFRYFCHRKAVQYRITGYARNLFNGDVELEAFGEKKLLLEFINDLKRGPVNSKVSSVSIEESENENNYTEFRIL